MKKIYCYLINSFMNFLVLKPPGFRKLSHFSEMRNDALIHREGLKGYVRILIVIVIFTERYYIEPQSVTVSGFGSGGAFASQLHVAFSTLIRGIGIFAGGKLILHLCHAY